MIRPLLVRLKGWSERLRPGRRNERRIAAAEFDAAFYRAANPDAIAAGYDPLDHFLTHGWREGRDPSPRFSVRDYLDSNPDVAGAGVNPFLHYLTRGRDEHRPTAHGLGFRYDLIGRLHPIEDQIAERARLPLGPALAPDVLATALGKAVHGVARMHVTFSHDDYRTRVGGLQLCLQREAAAVAGLGLTHLHLFPEHPWGTVRAGEPGQLVAVVDGRLIGTFSGDGVAAALTRAGARGASLAIHSLLGHDADEVLAIAAAAGLEEGVFWLHDYASLCAGFNLLRNGVEDCGAPPPDSAACAVCVFGPARARHLEAHDKLFRRLRLTVVSPAASTLAFWQAGWDFPTAGAVVHPHATLRPRGAAPVSDAGRPVRVAHVGYPVPHKGWPIFRDLAVTYADDPRYAFVHLGAEAEPGIPVEFHDIRISPDRPDAMREALERLEIDVVLFWPLWRETFSFTVYEAIAAGCAVITGPDSGNVAAVVAELDAGWVMPDEAALEQAFAEGRIADLARAVRRPMLYDLDLSGMTADLIAERAAA